MKKLLVITPIAIATTVIVPPTTIAIVEANAGWVTDENFIPDVEQYESDRWLHPQNANEEYFSAVMKDPSIMTQDYAWSLITRFKQHIDELKHTKDYTNVHGNFKVRLKDLSIQEKVVQGLKHYFGTFTFQSVETYVHNLDTQLQSVEYTEIEDMTWQVKTVDMGLRFAGNMWVVSTQNLISIRHYDWEEWITEHTTNIERCVEKATGKLQHEYVTKHDNTSHRSSEFTSMPSILVVGSYFFQKAKPYLALSVATNHPEGVSDPIIKNADDVPMGADYDTDVVLDLPDDQHEWIVAGIDVVTSKGTIKIPPKYWTFTTVNGIGKLHIDGVDDWGDPVVKYNYTVHMTYQEKK